MVQELKKLPNPIEDKRHNLYIYFDNNQARSNQTRFQHLFTIRHMLKVNDIRRIKNGIKTCIFRKDLERTDTYNIYIKRFSYSDSEYIKISLQIDPRKPRIANVKTMFITKTIK